MLIETTESERERLAKRQTDRQRFSEVDRKVEEVDAGSSSSTHTHTYTHTHTHTDTQ